ncbi:MAG: divalent-cation tolerance protein CutA [Rhodospirillales bacterium CG15_BIG_FIL_POST_REV_8_21_14_020_66_15]|nr:MAG: divalent-cation tolerance protein CutA [Rhodospirillales bacterium CG15_BIG_FIL_POST_REV_8_21_14_020_66_15]
MTAKLIYMTAADTAEARRISEALVGERLIACANILGAMESVYWWQGKVTRGDEVAVILKTRAALVDAVIARAAELHSYDCPCLVVLDIGGGHAPFLDWISAETGG